jgi:hypothetical protein
LSKPQGDNSLHAFYFVACVSFFTLYHCHISENTFAALAIIAENSFWLSGKFPSNIQQATKHYLKSPVARNVSTQIQTSFSNSISAIQSTSASEYTDKIATPLTDLVISNLLRMFHLC